jgi:AcrR family transcriptional regulator
MARSSSADTRAAILDAARRRFAIDGYERATIRGIAADARIDPAMVMRYFGSKDRLFTAAADFDLRLPEPGEPPYGPLLVRHFLHVWEADGTFAALLRAAASHPGARERLRGVFAGQIAPTVIRLAPDRPVERAGLIASQMLGLALCRYVLELEPVASMAADDVVAWIAPTIDRYLAVS